MSVNKLVSIKTIISMIVTNLGLGDAEIASQDFIEWISDGIKQIGAYPQFEEKYEDITITDYKGKLPCDFYKMIRLTDGVYVLNHNQELVGDEDAIQLATVTNTDFKVVHDTVTVSFRTGKIKIKYLAIPVDDCGFPFIPDDPSYSEALFWKVAYHLSIRGELKNRDLTFDKCERRWKTYKIVARGEANMPDPEMMNRIALGFNTLRSDPAQYQNFFKGLGNPSTLDR